MRKKLILSAVTIMSLGTLAACQNKTRPVVEEKTSVSTPASSSSSASSSVSSQSSSEEKKSTTPWDSNKDQQLEAFINSWAPTMNQSYQKYTGGASLHTIVGTDYPDVFKTMPFEMNGQRISVGYTPTGQGNYDYNVVAIYNYNKRGIAAGHITYLFAFHNGQPVALVDQTTEGGVTVVKPTANQQVASSFASIAEGSSSSGSETNQSTPNSSSTSTKQVSDRELGIMVVCKVSPKLLDYNPQNLMYGIWNFSGSPQFSGYSFITTGGDPTGWIYYKKTGDQVAVKYVDVTGADSVANAPVRTKYFSYSALVKEFYTEQRSAEVTAEKAALLKSYH